MDLIQVMGKKGRRVPILILPSCRKAMELLVRTRDNAGIHSSNSYMFPTTTKDGHIDAWQALQKIAKKAGCQKVHLISATKLRKYAATVCQVTTSC